MQLHRRLEKLEAATAPAPVMKWHGIVMLEGETEEQARVRYGDIGDDDGVILLVPVAPRFNPDGTMLHYCDWPENQS